MVIALLVQLKSEEQEVEQLSAIFKQLNTSNDGYLKVEEVKQGFKNMDIGLKNALGKEANWEKVVKSMVTDNDGNISYDMFITAASDRVKLLTD